MHEYFAGVGDRVLDPLTWVKATLTVGLCLLASYPFIGERPWGAPRWMDRVASRLFVRGRVTDTDGLLIWGLTTLMGVYAAACASLSQWREAAMAIDATLLGLLALRVYDHLGLTNGRLAEAEAELKAVKEVRREDEATPA